MRKSGEILRYRLLLTFILILFFQPFCTAGHQDEEKEISIIKPASATIPNFSGDNQFQIVKLKTEKPIRVQVFNQDIEPVANFPVHFEILSAPFEAEDWFIQNPIAYSDSNGIAKTYITLGSKEGEYEIAAKIKGNYNKNILIYRIYARKSNWVLMLIFGLVGGLGLFLLGIKMMSDGMQKAAGDKMRSVLSTLTNNRIIAVGVGAFVTMMIQSSSATTVMLVSFVQSGLMQFVQSLGIILGADIGTTITAQLIAFKLADYSLLLIGVGFAIQFFSKKSRLKNIGKTILGFGILFFGMHIMSESMTPLRSHEPFIEILLNLENPLIGILIGTIFTALIQSSSAFVGILIVLGTQGLLSLEAAIPLLFGANLGTSITAILASINTKMEAKKVAFAHTLFKVVGVLLFAWWIPDFAQFIQNISPKGSPGLEDMNLLAQVLPRQIANAHTVFNVALTIIALPFTTLVANFINKLIPKEEEPEKITFRVKYLEEKYIPNPTLALNLAKQEVIRMAQNVQDIVSDIILPFFVKETRILKEIEVKEKKVNFLRYKIKTYLMKITQQDILETSVREAFQIMYTVNEFEQMADLISKNLIPKAKDWASGNLEFSDAGKKEIMDYHLKTQKQISRAIEVFRDVNLERAKAMKAKYKQYRNLAIELERLHYSRLKEDIDKSVESSETHLELMNILKVITSLATNIARILLEWSNPDKKL
jgi:phosphate:Na+ symporter